jgi:hypothetical protein
MIRYVDVDNPSRGSGCQTCIRQTSTDCPLMPSGSAKTLIESPPDSTVTAIPFQGSLGSQASDKVMEGDSRILPGSLDAVQLSRSSCPHDGYP